MDIVGAHKIDIKLLEIVQWRDGDGDGSGGEDA